jgi:hypothetical protein
LKNIKLSKKEEISNEDDYSTDVEREEMFDDV